MNQHDANQPTGLEVAIIGMTGRFPGAADIDTFWRNLRDGVESILQLDDAELDDSAIDDPALRRDPAYVKAAAILEGADLFDPAFFGITPKEAELMDPQQRVFLECAWQALEDAGYDPERHRGGIGVYAGARTNTYVFNLLTNRAAVGSQGAFEIGLANDLAFLTTRVSHRLNLRGPAYSVHTACSTSLVAVHLACQALLADECAMALAGGVAINVPQRTGYLHQFGGITSPDGHCRPFDAQAQGTVFGSGVGVVVLKRLRDAIADGDSIRAVIRGSAINNDGSAKASFTAPGVGGQTRVIRDALAAAEVEARSITYVEAHGTGTALGDPIEVRALSKAFRADTDDIGYCGLGSVKSNVGHLDAAAGVTSLIKTTLMLQHGERPPTLHFAEPNPQIDFSSSPFVVDTALRPWPQGDTPRRAGVSSFGIGGTNAHIILEEAPANPRAAEPRECELLVLSAKTEEALELVAQRLADHLEHSPALELSDVAWTLQIGRQAFDHRRVVTCQDRAEAISSLRRAPAPMDRRQLEMRRRPVGFVFPDAERTPLASAAALASAEPRLRRELAAVLAAVPAGWRERVSASLTAASVGQLPDRETGRAAAFVVQLALARLWQAWGIKPDAVIADGVGELAAACVSEVLSMEEAAALACAGADLPITEPTVRPAALPYLSFAAGGWLSGERPWRAVRAAASASEAQRAQALALARSGSPRMLLSLGGNTSEHDLASLPHAAAEPAGRSVLAAWLGALGQLWLAGVELDWSATLPGRGARRRVPLPTYPFTRQSFWVAPGTLGDGAQATRKAAKAANLSDWFHSPSWLRTPTPVAALQAPQMRWLLLMDDLGIGEALAEQLVCDGAEVVRAYPTGVPRDADSASHEVKLDDPTSYARLLQQLVEENRPPTAIAHLWSLTGAAQVPSDPSGFAAQAQRGYYSVLALGQAIAMVLPEQLLRLEVVTDRLFDLPGEHRAVAEKAAMLGPCKVLPQEFQSLSCRCIDLGAGETAHLVGSLVAELRTPPSHLMIAWRDGRRYRQVYQPLPLSDGPGALPLRRGGVYVVTGGLGGVGALLGEYLTSELGAHLVLIGRTKLPDRAKWPALLAELPEDDKLGKQLRLLQRLEVNSASVRTLTADVTDPAQLRAAFDQIERELGAVHGVLHAAGVTRGSSLYGSISELKAAESEAQFGPKVYGTFALESSLANHSPDFVMLFSSNASVLGGLGYAAYAAANSFLDAFACQRATARGQRWLSVSWDPWPEVTRHYAARTSMDRYTMTQPEAIECFRRLASAALDGHLVVATGDLDSRLTLWIDRAAAPVVQVQGKRSGQGAYVEPRTPLERELAVLWQDLLGIPQLSRHDDFFALGGHSLLATKLIGRLRAELKIELAVSKLFEVSTIAGLAQAIEEQRAREEEALGNALLERVAELSDDEIERELTRLAAQGEEA